MGCKLHRTKKGDNGATRNAACKGSGDFADFALTRKKGQKATFGHFFQSLEDLRRHDGLEARRGIGAAGQPARFYGKGTALRGDKGGILHQAGNRFGIKGGGHDDHHQILTQRAAQFQGQRKAQIGVQAAFVEFIEDHSADTGQVGVGLDHAGQDAFGHHLDAGGATDLGFALDAVSYSLPYRFAQGLRHPLRRGAGGKTTGFKHQDAALDQTALQQIKRHAGGLARPRRGLQHDHAARGHGSANLWKHIINRQGIGPLGHAPLSRGGAAHSTPGFALLHSGGFHTLWTSRGMFGHA